MANGRKERTVAEKAVAAVSVCISIAVIVLSVLQIFNIWNRATYVTVPLLGAVNLCQAYLQWKTSRKTACFCLVTAIIVFVCALVVYLL